MPLKNQDPSKTVAWEKLKLDFKKSKNQEMKSLFSEDKLRQDNFSLAYKQLYLDYSKNRIDKDIFKHLIELAKELDLKDGIEKLFSGDFINATEHRAVLHTALRDSNKDKLLVDNIDVKPEIAASLDKIKVFSASVISGQFKGFTGKAITDIVNIGIGGSDLGPRMVVEALQFYKNHLKTHFISNIDGDHVSEVLKDLNSETTLFVIVSKTFSTQETLTNAETAKKWFLAKNPSSQKSDIKHNFVAVSTNLEKVLDFGIASENIFSMWDWVGGRYSLWSAVGLSISLAVGFDNFKALLKGAYEMDVHFKKAAFYENMPVIMALISIWYNNFYKTETEVIIPYAQALNQLVPYLQQLSMESNGKSVDRDGHKVAYQTGNIIWGNTGTNAQHAFMQLVHQGTKLIPVDFIGFKKSLSGKKEHHQKLMANLYGQSEALYAGKTGEDVHLELKFKNQQDKIEKLLPFKVFEGNRPSNMLLIEKLSPLNLGSLLALYEHKTFVQGYIWNIYSFDQFGVELGKELANKIYNNKP